MSNLVYIINGPSINMLGVREPKIYGIETYTDLVDIISKYANEVGFEVKILQSNHEGDLVDYIQDAYKNNAFGIVINPGAYTHTSIAILDALRACSIRTVEVHISDIEKREDFRKTSYVSLYAEKVIKGHGIKGYIEALDYLCKLTSQ